MLRESHADLPEWLYRMGQSLTLMLDASALYMERLRKWRGPLIAVSASRTYPDTVQMVAYLSEL
jgi:hypothetical protein